MKNKQHQQEWGKAHTLTPHMEGNVNWQKPSAVGINTSQNAPLAH